MAERSGAAPLARAAAATPLLLLLVLGLPLAAQDLPKRGERWSAATIEGLEVLGPVPARRLEEIASDLALGRAALLEIAGAPDHAAPYATTVVVFPNLTSLYAYHREADGSAPASSLLAALDRQGRLLALSLQTLERDLPLARELLAGDLGDQLFATPPHWVRAGLAALAGRLVPASTESTGARLIERLPPSARTTPSAGHESPRQPRSGHGGRPAGPAAPAPLTAAWPPLEDFLGAAPGAQREVAVEIVRHLANPRSERSSQFRRYLTLLRSGLPSEAAFEECFFQPFPALYADVAAVAARGGAAPLELEARRPAAPAASERRREDVLLVLGDLIARATPWNTVAAELHYRAVLDARPGDAAALRGIARVRELDGRHQDALPLWEQSLAADLHGVATRVLFGWSRLERFRRSVGTRRGWEDPLPAEVAAARELFLGAHTNQPPVHLLHGYGATFLYAREGFEPGLAALERAARLLPGDHQIAADRALLHAHAGDHETAWDLWRPRRDRAAQALGAEIEKLLVEEALQAANRLLLMQEDSAAAIALVERALEEAREPAIRAELGGLLAQMEKVAAQLERDALLDRFLHAYEEARRLVTERRFDEARRLLEPFATDELDEIVRGPARELLRQIDQVDR